MHHGDYDVRSLVERLMRTLSEPLYRMMRGWLVDGAIVGVAELLPLPNAVSATANVVKNLILEASYEDSPSIRPLASWYETGCNGLFELSAA